MLAGSRSGQPRPHLVDDKQLCELVENPSRSAGQCRFLADVTKPCKEEQLEATFQAVGLLDWQGIPVARDIVYRLLQGCSKKKDLSSCWKLYALMVCSGLDSVAVLGDHLIRLFASCGSLQEANQVFYKVSKPSTYTWNAIISAHARLGHGERALELYCSMQDDGIKPGVVTYACILKACNCIGSLKQGRLIHDQIIRIGIQLDVVSGNALLDMYVKCGSLEDACKVFDNLLDRNVISWSTVIIAYAEHGQGIAAIKLFEKMLLEGIKPDSVLFLCVLKACSSTKAIGQGRLMHKWIIRSGLETCMMIGNALVDMYSKCGNLDDAHALLERLPIRDLVTWSALIAGYVEHGRSLSAFEMFTQMEGDGIKPDKLLLSSILKACGSIDAVGQGRLIYDQIVSGGFESDPIILSTFVHMHAKCGSLDDAQEVFDTLQNRDEVSWGTMIAACVQHDDGNSALEYFEKMQKERISPEKSTLLCALKACGNIGAIRQARLVHEQIVTRGFQVEASIGNALVDVYAKCGYLEEAQKMLDKLPTTDVVSWGAIIAGYARNGCWRSAVQCFEDLQKRYLQPDDVIFVTILAACGHAGLLKEGCRYFKSMEDHGITPNIEHYNCLVDLLGRAGLLHEAEDLLKSIPLEMDAVGWMSLLTGCRIYGNREVGNRCFDQIVRLDPSHASGYMLVSNIYADIHMWGDVSKMQGLKQCLGVQKKPGTAWIEINNQLQEFVVGAKSQITRAPISQKSTRLNRLLKEDGYMPQLSLVLDAISNQNKEDVIEYLKKQDIVLAF